MALTAKEIRKAVTDYFRLSWTPNTDYYVGITSDPDKRRIQHGNPSDFFYCMAKDNENARLAEKLLLDMGMDGGDGGGTAQSIYVYCYKK